MWLSPSDELAGALRRGPPTCTLEHAKSPPSRVSCAADFRYMGRASVPPAEPGGTEASSLRDCPGESSGAHGGRLPTDARGLLPSAAFIWPCAGTRPVLPLDVFLFTPPLLPEWQLSPHGSIPSRATTDHYPPRSVRSWRWFPPANTCFYLWETLGERPSGSRSASMFVSLGHRCRGVAHSGMAGVSGAASRSRTSVRATIHPVTAARTVASDVRAALVSLVCA
jgi:hypothetical protein